MFNFCHVTLQLQNPQKLGKDLNLFLKLQNNCSIADQFFEIEVQGFKQKQKFSHGILEALPQVQQLVLRLTETLISLGFTANVGGQKILF